MSALLICCSSFSDVRRQDGRRRGLLRARDADDDAAPMRESERYETRRSEPCRHLSGGRAAVGDAVGDADAAEAAAGDEQAGVRRQCALDRRHAIEVPDLVLRVRRAPSGRCA